MTENQTKTIEEIIEEINELAYWFAKYDIQCSQYARCQRLGITYDKDIIELDELAEIKAARLKELRASIEELTSSK